MDFLLMDDSCFCTNQRIPPLDIYRVILLLCGFALHSIVFLNPNVFFQSAHIFRDALISGNGSLILNKLALFISSYYMPAFFILAGFFAEFLIKKYHYVGFLKNRGRRLFIPIAVIAIIIYSASLGYNCMLAYFHSVKTGLPIAWSNVWPRGISLSYLWFIEYLACMELMWFLLRFACRYMARLFNWNKGIFSPVFMVLMTVVLFLLSIIPLFIYKPDWFFLAATDTSIHALLCYGLHYFTFFLFGVSLVHFADFKKYATIKVATFYMIIGCCAYLVCIFGFMGVFNFINMQTGIILNSLFVWIFSIGLLMCCFNRYKVSSKKIKYLVDASYFLYLVQIPTIIFIVQFLPSWHLPFFLLAIIVMLLSFSIDVLIYQIFVRKRRWLSYIDGAKIQET
jgi:glucans biosynthesis protein C